MADAFFLTAPGQKRRTPSTRTKGNGVTREKTTTKTRSSSSSSLGGGSKRGASSARARRPAAAPKRRREEKDEEKAEKEEDSQDELGADAISSEESESEEEKAKDPFADETADEKRLRLAKELIEKLRTPDDDEASLDEEQVAERIRIQTRGKAGLVTHKVAESLKGLIVSPNTIKVCKNQHRLPITSVCVSDDEKFVFSASKDSTIVQWDVETAKKIYRFKGKHQGGEGHDGHVLTIATSTDGKFLASGGSDKVIRIWDIASQRLIGTLGGHKDSVSGLAFRIGSHQLFSASFDRAVKVWNVEQMANIDTLFGHQAEITSLDCLARERFVTSGRDSTARVWKVVEETQLMFQHRGASLDCIALLAEDYFVTGSQEGSITLWNATKKKPLHVVEHAHQRPGQSTPSWITSLASLRYSDVFASGSNDGMLRVWQWDTDARQIRSLCSISVDGFVNSIAFARSGKFVAVGVGKDHRLGRWFSTTEGDNSIKIIPLPLSITTKDLVAQQPPAEGEKS